MHNIAVIVGSLRKDSFNKQLFFALDKLNHPNLKFNLSKLDEIPLYNQDNENPLPPAVDKMKQDIAASDGLLFLTPEYNRSIPGMLKNVIDWGTRPYGKNVWDKKPAAVVGTSQGAVGTAVAQSHFRSIMVPLGLVLMGRPEVYFVLKEGLIDKDHTITDEKSKQFLQGFLDNFSQWMDKHK